MFEYYSCNLHNSPLRVHILLQNYSPHPVCLKLAGWGDIFMFFLVLMHNYACFMANRMILTALVELLDNGIIVSYYMLFCIICFHFYHYFYIYILYMQKYSFYSK